FTLSMAVGEYTLCFAGYLLAIELVRRKEPVLRRIVGLGSFAVPAALYLTMRRAQHYGASGAGFYHDPLSSLGTYLRYAPRRAAVLLSSAWGGLDDVSWAGASAWALALLVVTG